MLEHYKSIGVWGLGVVGRSLVSFIKKQYPHAQIVVHDRKTMMPDDHLFLEEHQAYYYSQAHTDTFLRTTEIIIPSPGIDLRPYLMYKDKFLSEIDFFCFFWKKPLIAITGTVGKTTITHISHALLVATGRAVAVGGNIGTPLMNLLDTQEEHDLAVLELSSYQLEYSRRLHAELAVITNIYPNHLDRHVTLGSYKDAKFNLLRSQHPEHKGLIAWDLYKELSLLFPTKSWLIHSDRPLSPEEYATLQATDILYYAEDNCVKKRTADTLVTLGPIPSVSYAINWVIIRAIVDSYASEETLKSLPLHFQGELPEHRLTYIGSVRGCAFYDDSKSTIMQATYAAVTQLHDDHQVMLLLGGTSKGVDRLALIPLLKNKIAYLICFGTEAPELVTKAHDAGIKAEAFSTLEEAFSSAYQLKDLYTKPAILLSPGGASFDLFTDYKARGNRFQQLVQELAIRETNTDKS